MLKIYKRAFAKAVLIAEDDKFWKHEGFDYESMKKAIERDVKAGEFKFGGRTELPPVNPPLSTN